MSLSLTPNLLYRQTTNCTEGGGLTREHCICIVTKYSTYLNYKIILLPRKVLVTIVTLLPATHSFSIGSSVSNLPEQCLHTVLFGIKTKLSPLLCTFCMIPELNTLVNGSNRNDDHSVSTQNERNVWSRNVIYTYVL